MNLMPLKPKFERWLLCPLLCARLAVPDPLLAETLETKVQPVRSQTPPPEPAIRRQPGSFPSPVPVTDPLVYNTHLFDELLVALNGPPTAEENQALADAIATYAQRADLDDFSSLTSFLDAFPASTWRGSLLLHLGVEYYNYGYFSRAVEAWEQAWRACERIPSSKGKVQADRALGELARMYSKLGRMHELADLLDSTKDRDLEGPATQLIGAAREALWTMQTRPEFCFRCGPLALDRILLQTQPDKAGNCLLLDSRSTTNGFSLTQVGEISRQLGMNYQRAYRSPGADFVTPAVIHWKVGHYAALLEHKADRFLVKDYTFRGTFWVSGTALEQEASGYFLVPPGLLPNGWRPVSEGEAQSVWGKGFVGGQDGDGTGNCDSTCGPCEFWRRLKGGLSGAANYIRGLFSSSSSAGSAVSGMASYRMHTMLVSLILDDVPAGYAPPVGPPVYFQASYHQREANQPATFSYSNLGPKWAFNWLSYITDNPQSPGGDVALYLDGGGTVRFTHFDPSTQTYAVEPMTQTTLASTSGSSYELRYPDGSRREFAQSDGSVGTTRRIFLTQFTDPAGNSVTLRYDTQLRITNIVDAIGQSTTLLYTNTAYPFAITGVVDPFDRSASLVYNSSGLLSQIIDVLGLSSQFAYGANQFVSALTTPYGVTTFATGQTNGVTYLQATDPLGANELLEYTQNPVVPHSLPASQVPHGLSTFNLFMDARNSFYWNKNAFAEGAGDYSKAKNYHWLHSTPNPNEASRILESEKEPLESRIWYNYPGQSTNYGAPYYLDAAYSGASAKPSVVARVMDDGSTQLYTYSYNAAGKLTNSIDPVGRGFGYIYDSNNVDLLEVRMTHNGKNELQSRTTYNSQHLPITQTDAAGQTTTNSYNPRGQILSITNPQGDQANFSYDTNGYLQTIIGPLGTNNPARFAYDVLGRLASVADTEGYTIGLNYDNLDRVTLLTFPDGTYQQQVFDKLALVASRDRLGRWTTNSYNAIGQLVSVQDPLGRVTQFAWCNCGSPSALTDPMGRTTRWIHDLQGRQTAKQYPDGSLETFAYETSTGRVLNHRDPTGQDVRSEYYPDNSLKRISFPNAITPTPAVSFTYDPDYDRVLRMNDGLGSTVYSYYPITSNPVAGAGKLQSISGPLPSSAVTYQYDRLGRIASRAINGASEAITYDALGRPMTITNTLGLFRYGYVGATLRPSFVAAPNGQTNLFSYYSNAGDQRLQQIRNLKADGSLLSSFGYSYNAAGELVASTNQWDTLPTRAWVLSYDQADQLVAAVQTDGAIPLGTNSYAYDAAGNRTLAVVNGATSHSSYNDLNQLISADNNPTNSITFEWDGAHRLTAINQGTGRTEFSYDGLDRRSRIVEKTNGVVASDNYFLWCGSELCEMRDATGGTVLKRFFAQGESIVNGASASPLFYTRDHLGSIREVLDSTGSLQARYDYDPYGQQTILSETRPASFAFTGDFQHRPSGMYFAVRRTLDPRLGRWLNRDPLQELAGLNLYAYAGNDPANQIDPSGEILPLIAAAIIIGAVAAAGYGIYTAAFTDHPIVTTWYGSIGLVLGGAAVGGIVGYVASWLAPAAEPIKAYAGPIILRLVGRITTSDCF